MSTRDAHVRNFLRQRPWDQHALSRLYNNEGDDDWAPYEHLEEQEGLLEGCESAEVDCCETADCDRGYAEEKGVDIGDAVLAIREVEHD